MNMIDKNISVIAKYFNVSPMDIMDGDFYYYMHSYALSVDEELTDHEPHREEVDSLFDAF